MPETQHKAHDVIASYRRRRERTIPMLLGALAVLLLAAGVVLIVMYLSGGSPGTLFAFLATDTPAPTDTPVPPTLTPTSEPTATETETPTPQGPITYRVEEGDNLWTIAAEYEVDLLLLMSVNGITDPDALYVGQEIIIPAPGTERPTATPLPATLLPGTRIEYIVEPGDTLYSIAAKFNSTAEAIARANNIQLTDTIGPGQRLIIPVGLVTPTLTLTPGTPTATMQP